MRLLTRTDGDCSASLYILSVQNTIISVSPIHLSRFPNFPGRRNVVKCRDMDDIWRLPAPANTQARVPLSEFWLLRGPIEDPQTETDRQADSCRDVHQTVHEGLNRSLCEVSTHQTWQRSATQKQQLTCMQMQQVSCLCRSRLSCDMLWCWVCIQIVRLNRQFLFTCYCGAASDGHSTGLTASVSQQFLPT